MHVRRKQGISFRRNFSTGLFAALCVTALAARASFAQGSCQDAVQGKIAWDYKGSTTWNPANVERLCSGATSDQPARCFDRALHGGIEWGGGTQWQWTNAIDLCAATADADATIRCFQSSIRQAQGWQTAIAACKAKPRQSCQDAVQGKIAWDYKGSTTWNPANVDRLCRRATSDQPARCFDRALHGGIEWGGGTQWQWTNAIDLCAATADADTSIRCFTQQIGQGQSWQAAVAVCKSTV
ncbi:MAG TPA: hypothetical protein VHQ90_14700 [Thermoanaerobaculia bacterium]|nr:hypothetical protein [Thermoanaerobaculia bacterium]